MKTHLSVCSDSNGLFTCALTRAELTWCFVSAHFGTLPWISAAFFFPLLPFDVRWCSAHLTGRRSSSCCIGCCKGHTSQVAVTCVCLSEVWMWTDDWGSCQYGKGRSTLISPSPSPLVHCYTVTEGQHTWQVAETSCSSELWVWERQEHQRAQLSHLHTLMTITSRPVKYHWLMSQCYFKEQSPIQNCKCTINRIIILKKENLTKVDQLSSAEWNEKQDWRDYLQRERISKTKTEIVTSCPLSSDRQPQSLLTWSLRDQLSALRQDLLLEVLVWEEGPLQRAHFSHIRTLLLVPKSQTSQDDFLLSALCHYDFEAVGPRKKSRPERTDFSFLSSSLFFFSFFFIQGKTMSLNSWGTYFITLRRLKMRVSVLLTSLRNGPSQKLQG